MTQNLVNVDRFYEEYETNSVLKLTYNSNLSIFK